ncbi:BREX system P-loop protein BrxC [Pseudohongiella sp.]|uniref:Uncharacterized protein n=1 Tax=marine sediment metagenome TaxID=412755 RepID=A0A0F9YH56_9ZZZZ|nr:BREX system P-loop protein BrxC [Pseudohongiella sp.]HDZ09174.1 BREX system P-loop protein BrxC [Pseudohongiella sp.]
MKIEEIFVKPLNRQINGVVKADQNDDATVYQELDEYVVTRELETHFRSFFSSYATPLNDPSITNRVGVWISGFFGSGKSHFLKTLSYLIANKAALDESGNSKNAADFFDETKLRDAMIRADISKAVSEPADVILFNIDSKASTNDGGNAILSVFLRVFNEHQGFSSDHPHVAHMERHLTEKGVYGKFKETFHAATGNTWEDERDAFEFYQDDVEKALGAALDLSPEAAHKWYESAEQNFSVSVEKFCEWVKEYLESKPANHRILFLVDEVGQYIGSDSRLMLTLQTLTENLGTICKGRAWIIVTSQADMDSVLGELSASKANDFSKIAGRFKTRLSLSSSNTDEVIQKRLLRKTPDAESELLKLYESKGDILRNQISFDRSGPTLKSYDNAESFIANYPFVPYQFQLVQKIFEEIRKVGATGAHLAYGERSMLDAFQMAAQRISNQSPGALVPMHSFYHAVEGFLDTAVKRTIDQAANNPVLDEFDVQLLRTLFMIRYVDLIKGTPDNLVTLCIEQIDTDKLVLRRQVEDALIRLEKESLITRNGDEFVFLTNEERDISRKIKATDIAGNEENKELSSMIYRDLLRDKNRFRYSVNNTDYSIGRYLDSHTIDGRYENDLRVEVISPLDPEYAMYSESGCINRSTEGPGTVLIKLPDDKTFFTELRTWLRTNKFVRLNDDNSQPELSRILADRGRENQERKKRLRLSLEDLLLRAEVYALGQHLKLNTTSPANKFDEACQYLLENTYHKLAYLRVLQKDPMRELHAVLHTDDIAQLGIKLDGEEGNPQAVKEVDQYISLKVSGNESLMVNDIVDRFTKRPFGWPEPEILLILARLAVAGRITFHTAGPSLQLSDVFEQLQNSRQRAKVSVMRKRLTDENVLKSARDLSKDLFSTLGSDNEKELFEFYQSHFGEWIKNLKSYQSKSEIGRFPGKDTLKSSVLSLERLLAHDDSFEFFKHLTDNKNDYLELEEDYRDLHHFYTKQLATWQQLLAALHQFQPNAQLLMKDTKAANALMELQHIADNDAPYGQIQEIAGLVEILESANNALLYDKRSHAISRVEGKITQLQQEIDSSGISTPDLSNRLLMPLQQTKKQIAEENSVAQIYMLQTQVAEEKMDEALDQLHTAMQAENERQKKAAAAGKSDHTDERKHEPVAEPKPIADVSASALLGKVQPGLYLENQQDVDKYLSALRSELELLIKQNRRIRIRG